MNKILCFLDFFSAIEVEFVYQGKLPMQKSDLYSSDWEFKSFNGVDEMGFDDMTRRFKEEVDLLEVAINAGTIKALKNYNKAEMILALGKAETLRSKVVFREVHEGGRVESVWYFKGNEVIAAFMQFEQSSVPIKVYETFQALIEHIEELLSVDIRWLKNILDALIPLLRVAIDTKGAVMDKVKKEIKIPNNFVSQRFQPDVINSLFEQFVKLGYLNDDKGQKKSFCNAFSTKEYHKEISPKIEWEGDATILRGFLYRLSEVDPKFKPGKVRVENWHVADKLFKLPGENLSKEGSNGHYGSQEAIVKIKNAVEKALQNFDPSEE